MEAARPDRGVLRKAGGPHEEDGGGLSRHVLGHFFREDGEWVLEPEEMQRAERTFVFPARHLVWAKAWLEANKYGIRVSLKGVLIETLIVFP